MNTLNMVEMCDGCGDPVPDKEAWKCFDCGFIVCTGCVGYVREGDRFDDGYACCKKCQLT